MLIATLQVDRQLKEKDKLKFKEEAPRFSTSSSEVIEYKRNHHGPVDWNAQKKGNKENATQ